MDARSEQFAASLTPTQLQQIILELAKTQARDDPGVMVNRIVDTLINRDDLGTGSEGWQALLRLQQAIRDIVTQLPGMRYIEADS